MLTKRFPFAAFTALAIAFAASTAMTPALAQQDPTSAITESEMTNEKLRSFAVATLEFQTINQEYQPRFEAAASPEAQQQIAQEANAEMVLVVEQIDDLTVPEYNAIAEAARNNPEIMQQINTFIAESAAQ